MSSGVVSKPNASAIESVVEEATPVAVEVVAAVVCLSVSRLAAGMVMKPRAAARESAAEIAGAGIPEEVEFVFSFCLADGVALTTATASFCFFSVEVLRLTG